MRHFFSSSCLKAWERDLDHDEAETEPGAKKMYAALVPDQGAKVRVIENSRPVLDSNTIVATATTAFQQPHSRASFPRQELRRELEEAGSRPPGGLPEPQRERRRWYRRTYGQQQL